MGLIVCSHHGAQGVAINIQDDIVNLMMRNVPLREDIVILSENILFEEVGFPDEVFKYLVTKRFVEKHGLALSFDNDGSISSESISSLLNESMGIICTKCLREYLESNPKYKDLFNDLMLKK